MFSSVSNLGKFASYARTVNNFTFSNGEVASVTIDVKRTGNVCQIRVTTITITRGTGNVAPTAVMEIPPEF